MALTPIPSVFAAAPTFPVDAATSARPAQSVEAAFGQLVDKAMGVEQSANDAAVKLATGELTDIHQFTAAAAQAQLTVELTAAVRNRAVEAFNDIMRMQI